MKPAFSYFASAVCVLSLVVPAFAAEPDAPPKLPAQVLDLANFKLTLPSGAKEKPDEIKQPALAGYTSAEYFRTSDDQKSVLFTAPAYGVTTKGSNYPRSELREMTDGGKTSAAWSTSEGKHRMIIREAITHLPDKKPHVVAAQIHDGKSDVITVRLEKSHLFIEHGADKNIKDATLTKDYKLGSVFTVEIVAEGGHIKVFYNNDTTPADDFAIESTGCYFKAGCYTQSNESKGEPKESFGQVAIYEIKIDHTAK